MNATKWSFSRNEMKCRAEREEMRFDFSGRSALVTGGTKGIGKACVLLFARLGANVLATYSRDEAAAQATRQLLDGIPGNHSVIRCDMADHGAIRSLLESLDSEGCTPEILVSNAAYQKKATVADTDVELMEQTFHVNVLGNYVMIRGVADLLVETGKPGVVIVNSSNQSELVNPTGFAYALTKVSLNHMVRHLALAYSAKRIRVNGILLGWFDTEGEREFYSKDQIANQAAQTIPLGRAGDPGEAARLIAYIASDHAAYLTGSLIRLDGGFSLAPDLSI